MSGRQRLLIFGAGAIGRGYVPWVFAPKDYEYTFADTDIKLIHDLQTAGEYTTHRTAQSGYESRVIRPEKCLHIEEVRSVAGFDAIVTAVGPRNVTCLKNLLSGTKLPILCFENDSQAPKKLRNWTGNQNVVFGIPDVIASCTASPSKLQLDPLCLTTETGECFIDASVFPHLKGDVSYVDQKELDHQWLAKLYIHNTPHCIAAYLGSLLNLTYVHESMEYSAIRAVLDGCMDEISEMLRRRTNLDPRFIEYYRDKELQRFANKLLFDPITRVAREPFRKLGHHDRLIGASQFCLASGVVPFNIFVGILAALCFERASDPDHHIRFLRNSTSPEEFLEVVLNMRPSEALFIALLENWDSLLEQLKEIRHGKRK